MFAYLWDIFINNKYLEVFNMNADSSLLGQSQLEEADLFVALTPLRPVQRSELRVQRSAVTLIYAVAEYMENPTHTKARPRRSK